MARQNFIRRMGNAIKNSRVGRAVRRVYNRTTGKIRGNLPSPNMVGGGH